MDGEIVRNVEDPVTHVHTIMRWEGLEVGKEESEEGMGVTWKPGTKFANQLKYVILEQK